MTRILVVGSVALDSVKTSEGESRDALGGSAVYFSLAARHFAPVSIVGVVGRDFPSAHRRMLEGRGIDLAGLRAEAGKTFRWAGKYGRDMAGAKTLETQLNVFKDFRPALSEEQKGAPVLFLANIDPELQADVLAQMRRPQIVACDTMNFWIASKLPALKELLSKVHIFFGNEEEAKKLTRQPNALRAARVISEWGPSVVVIKKGEHGAVLKAGKEVFVFPAFPLETVKDPTGAGDSFAGGFMGYLASVGGCEDAHHLKRAVLYGTVMASFNVEDFSTRRLESLERGDLEERFVDFLERLTVPREAALA